MSNIKRKILVIGATGFVGRRFCQTLINRKYYERYELIFTARSKSKFDQLFPDLNCINIKFEELDTFNQREVDELIKQKYAVCNFVGPFAKYAPNIIAACAKYGVHYLDITGEINFIKNMILKHDEEAKKNGASIIPFSGFDSVPSDLGVHLIKKKINQLHNEDIQKAHIVYNAKGGINGGTIASAFESISTISKEEMMNLHYLCPNERAYFPPLENKFRKNQTGQFVAPFFMEPINNKIVYRTKFLADHKGYAKNFIYEESMYTNAKLSFISSLIVQKSLDLTDFLMKKKATSKVLRKILPKPGQGPSEKAINNGFFNAEVVGISRSGKIESLTLKASGDPGNKATVNLVLLCLECLCEINNPPPGFQTPVSCFGDRLEKNMNNFELSIKEHK